MDEFSPNFYDDYDFQSSSQFRCIFRLDLSDSLSSESESPSIIRVSTAPARPLTDLEEFKRSSEFLLLE